MATTLPNDTDPGAEPRAAGRWQWLTPDDRRRLTQRSMPWAAAYFAFAFSAYAVATVLAVAPLPWWANLFFSVWSGLLTGGFFVIGHDALHQSFTPYRRLNTWIGRIAMLPACYSASLWVLYHNRTHHRFTNLKNMDGIWEPWSPEDYARAGPIRRALYRLYRSPLGPAFYHMFELAPHHLLPYRGQARREWRRHLFDSLFVVVFYPLLSIAIVWLGATWTPERPLWLTVIFGWALPFFVWHWVYAFVIYLHHTHPEIAWFDRREDWTFHRSQVIGTTGTRLPLPMQVFSNHIMEHTAHHANQGIPLYHLKEAQRLIQRAEPKVRFVNAGREYLAISRACKLFDFRRRQWTDFNGRATGPAIPVDGTAP